LVLLSIGLRGRYSFNQPNAVAYEQAYVFCDSYANEVDIIFNAGKSKFFACIPGKLRSVFNNLNYRCFLYWWDRPIENVTSYSQDDVLQRRCHFTVQAKIIIIPVCIYIIKVSSEHCF